MKTFKFVIEKLGPEDFRVSLINESNAILFSTSGIKSQQEAINLIGILKKYSSNAEVYDLSREDH